MKGTDWADSLVGKTTITSGFCLEIYGVEELETLLVGTKPKTFYSDILLFSGASHRIDCT